MDRPLDLRLEGPLRRIAELAVAGAPSCHATDVDLFQLRNAIGNDTKEPIIAYLHTQVERLTNGQRTVREVAIGLIDRAPLGLHNVFFTLVDAGAPEGVVTKYEPGMLLMAVCGATPGYTTFSPKR